MRATTLCNLANLLIVFLVWASLVVLPNWLHGGMLSIWVNIPLVVIAMPISGYFVQYVVSRHVNNLIMGPVKEEHENKQRR